MDIKIYYQDTDCGGVVYYANYLTYMERDRTEWLAERGVSVTELAASGVMFVVSRAELDYKSPAKYEEVLHVRTTLTKLGGVSFNLDAEITEKESGRAVVNGKCTMVCVGKNMKPRKIPAEVISKIKERT